MHDTRRFGGDARLVVEGEQQVGLNQLAVNQRRAHGQERLVREDGRAFRHGADVATEAEVGEVVEKFGGEDAFAAQEGDVVRGVHELPLCWFIDGNTIKRTAGKRRFSCALRRFFSSAVVFRYVSRQANTFLANFYRTP